MRDKPWPGMHQDTTDFGDGLVDVQNIQYRIAGELRRRPGMASRIGFSTNYFTGLESAGGRHLIGWSAGVITSYNMATTALTTLKSGLSSSAIGCFARSNNAVYYCNGADPMQVIYRGDTAASAAGISAPAAAPTAGTPAAGSITAGVHLIRYRYKNSATGYLSNPSAVLSFTAAGSQNCPLTLAASADAKVTNIVIEMTQAAGSTFYVVGTTTNTTSYTISIADTVLGQQQLSDTYAYPDGYGHDAPPTGLIAIYDHRNRLFGIDSNGYLYWSRASFPEGWNVVSWAHQVNTSNGDKPVALYGFFGDLYIFGTRGMSRFVFTGDPAQGMLVNIPASFGVWHQRTLVSVEGAVWGWGRQGIFMIDAIQPKHMSTPIQKTLADDVDIASSSQFHAFFDPNERVIWFCYKAVGDTGVRRAVCYDLNTATWSRRTFRHQIRGSLVYGDSVTDDVAYLADNNGGYTWTLTDGELDGLPSNMSSGVVTATTGSTGSIINVNESLSTSPTLVGAILYNPISGEERTISANTASQITVSSAFSTTPANGTELYIGSIPCYLLPQWMPVHYVYAGRRPDYFKIEHLSDTTGLAFKVQYYLDYESNPYTWTANADDAPMNGFSVVNGANYATVDVSHGKNHVPSPAEFMLTLRWALTQERPVGEMKLLDATWEWRDQKGAQDIGH